MILASRFGGTPWAWRWQDQPDERDWGTAVRLLEEESEKLKGAE